MTRSNISNRSLPLEVTGIVEEVAITHIRLADTTENTTDVACRDCAVETWYGTNNGSWALSETFEAGS